MKIGDKVFEIYRSAYNCHKMLTIKQFSKDNKKVKVEEDKDAYTIYGELWTFEEFLDVLNKRFNEIDKTYKMLVYYPSFGFKIDYPKELYEDEFDPVVNVITREFSLKEPVKLKFNHIDDIPDGYSFKIGNIAYYFTKTFDAVKDTFKNKFGLKIDNPMEVI